MPVDPRGAGRARARGGRRGGEEAGRGRRRSRSTTARCRSRATPPTSRTGSTASAAPATPSSIRTSPTSRGWRSACSAIPAARGARRRPATRRSACATPRPRRSTSTISRPRWRRSKPRGGFMSAASPGVVSLFFRNDHYKDFETYIYAIAEAMRARIRDRRQGRLRAADRLPRSRHGPAHPVRRPRASPEFRKRAQLHVEALNHALAEHSARAAAHASVLGQLRGPAPLRRAARRHHRHRVHGAAERDLASRPPIRATPTNGRCSRRVKLPDGKVLIPGVIESKSNFIEHPELIAQRIGRYAKLVGRENVIAGTDCGYGTWVGQAAVDPDVVWAKLAAMAEGARDRHQSSSGRIKSAFFLHALEHKARHEDEYAEQRQRDQAHSGSGRCRLPSPSCRQSRARCRRPSRAT